MSMNAIKSLARKRFSGKQKIRMRMRRGDLFCYYLIDGAGLLYIGFRNERNKDDKNMFFVSVLIQRIDGSEQLCLYTTTAPYLKKGFVPFGKPEDIVFLIDENIEETFNKIISDIGIHYDMDTGLPLDENECPV